ncbi:hypothetical protein PACTADRAFT_33645 [Pachysolen tannophilus NRRL Y-2460]|uniref:DUF1640 domain-containing protein n=1 Tax=Pachysolen tannophilus NRRL Y-2460 TaxID=669874 RepID=A0A1E4TXT8_PACTA|nr:hypothetical protein PACTADRAFT_33645 [Pachysolen tannophilus NRRL Y-2460]
MMFNGLKARSSLGLKSNFNPSYSLIIYKIIFKKKFHSTIPKNLNSNFDTQHFVEELEQNGFTSKQSQTAVKIFTDSINDSFKIFGSNLITKEKLSKLSYQQKVDFAKLKSELQTTDRSEFNKIKNEYEYLKDDLEKVRIKLKEEINRSLSSVRLDLNLEKGRIREESSIHDLKIKETDTRIDQEISNIKMQIDSVKTQVMQWLIGVCTGTFALVLAYVRLMT